MSERPIDRMLARLDAVRQTGPTRWMARCPAHNDRNPSLSIREADHGLPLVHCFAACETADVLGAVGLTFADLFPNGALSHRIRPSRSRLSPRDALRAIAHEVAVIVIYALDIANGRKLTDADIERILTAARRIGDAVLACC